MTGFLRGCSPPAERTGFSKGALRCSPRCGQPGTAKTLTCSDALAPLAQLPRSSRQPPSIDLADHVRFQVELKELRTERPGQAGTELAVLHVDAYTGVKRVVEFTVDVVVGSTITARRNASRRTW